MDVSNFPELVAPIGAALVEARRQHQSFSLPAGSVTAFVENSPPTRNQPTRTFHSAAELPLEDQEAVKQLVKRLSKNLRSKDGLPLSPQLIRLALEELIGGL